MGERLESFCGHGNIAMSCNQCAEERRKYQEEEARRRAEEERNKK